MPIYEYTCEDCGSHIEKIQKFSDPLLTVCPKCGGSLQKDMSLSSFHLKGSGWYVTDYAKGNGNGTAPVSKPKEDSKESASDSTSKTETKSETKSETKTESKPASSTSA